MDTLRIYNRLCLRGYDRRDDNPDYEVHHIIPKSMGGDDHPRNLCLLTVREHFLAHLLLAVTESATNLYESQWQAVAAIGVDSTNPNKPRRFNQIRLKKWQRKHIGYYTAKCYRIANLNKARERFNQSCNKINYDYINLILDLAEIDDIVL